MANTEFNIDARFNAEEANSQIDRLGEKMRNTFDRVLPSDAIRELNDAIENFRRTGNMSQLTQTRHRVFGEVERQHQEDMAERVAAVEKKYRSDLRRAKKDPGNLTYSKEAIEGRRQEALKEIQNTSKFDKDLKGSEKAFQDFLNSIRKMTVEEEKGVNQKVNLFKSLVEGTQGSSTSALSNLLQSAVKRGGSALGKSFGGASGAAEGLEGAEVAGGLGLMTAGIAAAAAVVIGIAIKRGYEELRADKRVNAILDTGSMRDSYGGGYQDIINSGGNLAYSRQDVRQMLLSASRGRLTGAGLGDLVERNMTLQRGYGLDEGEVGGLNKFFRSDTSGKNSSDIIIDILARSEKEGILGVSRGDFAGLPNAIKNVENILSYQRSKADTIDSTFGIALQVAGAKIGGAFGDDRGGQTITSLLQGLSQQSNPGLRALNLRLAQQAMPGATPYELETGIRENNPAVVLKQLEFARRIQGGGQSREMIERILDAQLGIKGSKLTDMMDKGGIDTFINQLRNATTAEDRNKIIQEAGGRAANAVTNLDSLWTNLKNSLDALTEKMSQLADYALGIFTWLQKDNVNKVDTKGHGIIIGGSKVPENSAAGRLESRRLGKTNASDPEHHYLQGF